MDFERERKLIEEVRAGKVGAYEKLYDLYKDQAYHTAVFLTGNMTDAQDVVQDTFVTVFQELGKLKEPSAFRSWFYRILTRNAIHLTQRRKREVLKEEVQEIPDEKTGAGEDIPELLSRQEESKILRKYIDEMDEKHRTVLVLYYYNEFSVGQIAQITGCLAGTVKSRLYHARKQLKQRIAGAERK